MESLLTVLLLALFLLVYFSNRKNPINQWCAFTGFLFWLGLAKEAIAYNLLPFLGKVLGLSGFGAFFMLPYSLMTWALYALAVPTAILFALAMNDKLPPLARRLLFYVPAALISCVYYPWQFPIYQKENTAFWIAFACYNILGCAVFAFLMIRAVTRETDRTTRGQKLLVVSITLPPILFWVLSVFLTHPLHLTSLNKLWQLNIVILLVCIAFYIFVAFRGGMMGLRLTGESYRWNSDMGLIRKGVSYTGHMIKNQTAKMTWCVENLKAQYSAQGNAPPEELAILTRSIAALRDYTEKSARRADAIVLSEGTHALDEMLNDAFLLCAHPVQSKASLCLTGTSGIALRCDRTHMIEVFLNLFTNAMEAGGASAPIEVYVASRRGGKAFSLSVTDRGAGVRSEDIARVFEPYFTTKGSTYNPGLGLSYCKNVIERHGGALKALSKEGEGTTMIIRLPAYRVLTANANIGNESTHHA